MAKLKYTCVICGKLMDDVSIGCDDDVYVCLSCEIEDEEAQHELEDWLVDEDPEDAIWRDIP
jgi:DNA-directed RNA polymerase subunit RPC12/RpoP